MCVLCVCVTCCSLDLCCCLSRSEACLLRRYCDDGELDWIFPMLPCKEFVESFFVIALKDPALPFACFAFEIACKEMVEKLSQ